MLDDVSEIHAFDETKVTIETPVGSIVVRLSACKGSNASLDIDLPETCKIAQVDECEF